MEKAITVNITILGYYFLPYMLLAIIHDPLQTVLIYCIEAVLITFVYFILLGFCYLIYVIYIFCQSFRKEENSECCFLKAFTFTITLLGVAMSFVLSAIIIIFIIIRGGLGDFEALKEQKDSVFFGVVALSMLKLLYSQVR